MILATTFQTPAPASGPAPASSTPDDRSTAFQPVEGGTEQHNGATLLVEAYALIWIIMMAWLLFLWRRQGSLGARLDDLERAIDRAAASKAKAKSG